MPQSLTAPNTSQPRLQVLENLRLRKPVAVLGHQRIQHYICQLIVENRRSRTGNVSGIWGTPDFAALCILSAQSHRYCGLRLFV